MDDETKAGLKGLTLKDLESLFGKKFKPGDVIQTDELMIYGIHQGMDRAYIKRGSQILGYGLDELRANYEKKGVYPIHDFMWADLEYSSEEGRWARFFLDKAQREIEAQQQTNL